MNKYRKERIEMITAMMMAIANIPEKAASELLKSTITYKNIVEGEECTLYESYSANLEDVVGELQENNKGKLVDKITEEAVSELNKWMLDEGIVSAKQLKESINAGYAVIIVEPNKKRIVKHFSSDTAHVYCKRKLAKQGSQVSAHRPGSKMPKRNKVERVTARLAKRNSIRQKKHRPDWKD